MSLSKLEKTISIASSILLAGSALIAFGYSYTANRAKNIRSANRTPHPSNNPITAQPEPVVTAFTAPGLRVAIGQVEAGKIDRSLEVSFSVTNGGNEETEELDLLLLEFTAAGVIDRVVGRKFNTQIKPREAQKLLFTADLPPRPGHSLMLTMREITGKSSVQNVSTFDLLQGLVMFKSGGGPPVIGVKESGKGQTPLDPNFCHAVFRAAHNLKPSAKNKAQVIGYTCSQAQESFSIAYLNQ